MPIHRGPNVIHRPIPASDLDRDAVKIVQRLTRFDHSAYLVGGCVRDLLLERQPKDFDIGTSATPRQIKRLFRNSRIIGRRFRLAHVYFQNGKIIEVATFRAQNGEDSGVGSDGAKDLLIREDNLFGTVEQDALRRDFTVNALFYDVNKETVIDHADGLGDLRRRLIRTIGDPELRFSEDPIRILRAIKFAARLDFNIESETLVALKRTGRQIPKAAPPRVLEEINRFCRGGAAQRSFELLRETAVFEIVLPELAKAYGGNSSAWELLSALMAQIDHRQKKGELAGTGAILTALLLPALLERFGWHPDGTVEPPQRLDTRKAADQLLGPLAKRLHLARKDQEHCRQTLIALFRMVPAQTRRRINRRALLARECFPDALLILGALDGLFHGEFAAAREFWSRAAKSSGQARRPAPEQKQTAAKSRSGQRRRPKSRRPADAAPRKPDKSDSPPPDWDDGEYFFAALPSVPDMPAEEGKGDRYGASMVAPPAEPKAEPPAEPKDESKAEPKDEPNTEPEKPKRKRRPRRRRRPSSSAKKRESDNDSGGGVVDPQ
jgi:poly(A) polymerase